MAGFNIANMFRNTQQVSLPQPNTNQQQTQQPQPTGKPGSTLDPNAGQNQGTGQPAPGTPQPGTTTNSPLDSFKDLWKDGGTGGQQSTDPFASPLFQTDPAKIREAAGQIDFLSQVPQELMQKAMAGNDPQAFMAVMNSVAQNALATSLQLATATTEQAGQRIGQRFNTALPGRFKDMQLQSTKPTNPALSHPAAQPMLQAVRQQIKAQNPDMSAEQIQQMAEGYLSSFASEITGADPSRPKPQASDDGDDFNWLQWAQESQTPQRF